jgi:hypothetical protein
MKNRKSFNNRKGIPRSAKLVGQCSLYLFSCHKCKALNYGFSPIIKNKKDKP